MKIDYRGIGALPTAQRLWADSYPN